MFHTTKGGVDEEKAVQFTQRVKDAQTYEDLYAVANSNLGKELGIMRLGTIQDEVEEVRGAMLYPIKRPGKYPAYLEEVKQMIENYLPSSGGRIPTKYGLKDKVRELLWNEFGAPYETESHEEEYTRRITEAKTLKELYAVLDGMGVIEGTIKYSAQEVKDGIERLREQVIRIVRDETLDGNQKDTILADDLLNKQMVEFTARYKLREKIQELLTKEYFSEILEIEGIDIKKKTQQKEGEKVDSGAHDGLTEYAEILSKIKEVESALETGEPASVGEPVRGLDKGEPLPPVEVQEVVTKTVEELKQTNAKFEKTFTGMKAEDLETIVGYKELTVGQKALVQENLQQIILGKIKEDAATRGAEEDKKAGFFGRVWRSITKQYQSAKLEKATAQDLQKAGIGEYKDIIEKLVIGTHEVGLDAVFDKEGNLEVLYTGVMQAETEAEEETLRSFNTAAHAFTNIPIEWARETASRSQRKQYKEAEKQYYQARDNAFLFLEAKNGDDKLRSAEQMNSIDARVRMDQLFSTHPEAEAQIQKISDEKVWVRSLKDIVTERGVYFGAGFATRAMTGALLGTLGLPLAAAGIGGFMARRRAQETLKQQQAGARRGVEDASTTAENIIHADESKKKIDRLIQRIEGETDGAKKGALFSQLEERIHYTEDKLYTSKMDFGTFDARLKNQLDIVQAISHASTFVAAHEGLGDKNHRNELAERLDTLTGLYEKKIESAQKKFLRDQMIHGAVMGAGFSTAGYVLRHFAPDMFGWPKRAPEMFTSISGNTELSEADIAMMSHHSVPHGVGSMDAPEAGPMSGGVAAATTESGVFESVPHPEMTTIEHGGNIWKSAKELGDKFNLDKKGFAEAWAHSNVTLPDGREIPIAELNLVHEGDVLSYIPGENGAVGHFEFTNASNIQFGDVLNLPGAHEVKEIHSMDFEDGVVPGGVRVEIPEEVVAGNLPGSMEQGVGDTSAEYTETATMPEDTTGVIANLPFEERVAYEVDSDLRGFFGEDYQNERLSSWHQWENMEVKKFAKIPFDNSDAITKFQKYIKFLEQESGVRPIGGIFRREEKLGKYMARAISEMVKKGRV